MTIEEQYFADHTVNYVKELFIHSCYSGFAFAEAMALLESHFEWEVEGAVWCKIYRQKSDELSAVPILKSAAVILNKYRNRHEFKEGDYIFPRISNQEVNRALKIIQAVCGIQFDLTFHIARHTFAKTIALRSGIPITTDTTGWQEKLDKKREIVMAARKLKVGMNGIEQWAN